MHRSACLGLVAIFAFPLGIAAEPSDPGLLATLEDFRGLAPPVLGFAVRNQDLQFEHLELLLDDGVVYPLNSPRGTLLGFYYEGRGRYLYRSEDAADRTVFRSKVERNAPTLFLHQHLVRDSFAKMVLFFARPIFPTLWDTPAPSHSLDPASRAAFDRLWRRVQTSYLPYDHLAAQARFNGGQYVYAEFDGDFDTIGYTYDEVRTFYESLTSFRKFADFDLRVSQTLSSQPVKGGPAAQPDPVHLAHARIAITTEDNKTGSIASELTVRTGVDGTRVLSFDLINNTDPYKYDWSSRRNPLRVQRVTDEAGRELPFSHRYHEVLVELPAPVNRDQPIRLTFDTEGEIFTDMFGERADVYFSLTSAWFPMPAGFESCCYTFELKIKTKKPYRPVSSGSDVVLRDNGEFYELESRGDAPSVLISVFAGKYKTREEKYKRLTVRVHAYAAARKTVLETMPRLAGELIDFYETHLGPYPSDELDIVEVPAYGLAMAPSGIVLLATEAYKPYQSFLSSYFSRGVNARLAHEIAHQWFGHRAVPSDMTENWLAESFAEYFAGLALGARDPDERQIVGFKKMLAEWQAESRLCANAGPIERANELGGEQGLRDRYCLLYTRGPLVLHMLRTMIGNEKFMTVMRRFLEQADGAPTSTGQLAKVASEVVQADLTWFFDQWFRQGGIPEVDVEHHIEESGGRIYLVGRAEQADGPGFKRLVIPLVWDGGFRLVDLDRPVKEFRFDLPAKPRRVSVDPHRNNLANYR